MENLLSELSIFLQVYFPIQENKIESDSRRLTFSIYLDISW